MRVVIAEDSVLLREGLARLLADGGIEVVAQVGDGPGLVAAVDAYRPDLAVVDVRMPPTHTDEGLRAAMEVRERAPTTAILVLSQYVEERYATDLLAGGAPRELDVLTLMAEGRSNAAIAEHLVITDGAVEKHISSIFGKLGLPAAPSDHRRVLAVLTYLRA
jgi:DNA-binding NarL/FixJ family response regulator